MTVSLFDLSLCCPWWYSFLVFLFGFVFFKKCFDVVWLIESVFCFNNGLAVTKLFLPSLVNKEWVKMGEGEALRPLTSSLDLAPIWPQSIWNGGTWVKELWAFSAPPPSLIINVKRLNLCPVVQQEHWFFFWGSLGCIHQQLRGVV